MRRACLRRRAFYASPCQATAPCLERFTHCAHSAKPLRPEVELTPSKVRKSNPFFFDVQCFQDDLGVENGGQNEVKIELKPSLGAFQGALGAGLPLGAILVSILDTFWHPLNTKNRAPATMRAQFRLSSPAAPGALKSSQNWCKIEAKSPVGSRWLRKPSSIRLRCRCHFRT